VVALVALGLGALLVPPKSGRDVVTDLAVAGIIALALAAVGKVLPLRFGILIPIGFIIVIGVLRHRYGGASSGITVLMFLPVVWIAAYRSTVDAILGVVAMTAVFIVPIVAFGPPMYPDDEWRRVIAFVLVAALIVAMIIIARNQLVTDPLTGIGNRRLWEHEIRQQMSRSDRRQEPLTVAILDLDHLKEFNDTHGHVACDAFLADCASQWEKAVRPEDVLIRAGGDEFFLMLPGLRSHAAADVLDRLAAVTPAGQSFSVGVATWDGNEDADAVMRRADIALYAAKHGGRGKIGVAPEAPDAVTTLVQPSGFPRNSGA
jgi:diguanylate cyclase (GGDEF)-like protein